MATRTETIDNLPSLPQVMLKVVDAIHKDTADFQQIADIIRQDAGMAARIINVANSSYFGRPDGCSSIERALILMGTDSIKTILITASIKQFFGGFKQQNREFLKEFWRRSLVAANVANVTASLTSFARPDEAYLCGLMLNVGQMILYNQHKEAYLAIYQQASDDHELLKLEAEQFGKTHCEIGADLIASWQTTGFMADAIRYHLEPATQLRDAHHLVKIMGFAKLMSSSEDINDKTLETADLLFGLNEALTRELRLRIHDDVLNIAQSLGIDIENEEDPSQDHSYDILGKRIGEITELAQISSELLQQSSLDATLHAIKRSLYIALELEHSTVFLWNDETRTLNSCFNDADEESDFTLPLEADRSLISDTLLDNATQCSLNQEPSSITLVDRQILQRLHAPGFVTWPLTKNNQFIGVLIAGLDQAAHERIQKRTAFTTALCTQISEALANSKGDFSQITAKDYEHTISEVLHEAGNPLSIIRNYLETLKTKFGEEHAANEELALIKEEIERVGHILMRLKEPQVSIGETSEVDLNDLLSKTAKIFRESICLTKNVTLNTDLDEISPMISSKPSHLQQIMTNLLKNAIEAVNEGGTVTITSDHKINVSGNYYCAVIIEDNGPGMPEEVMHELFSPITSTKGTEHSGLGLSIVKKLVDDLGGSIACRSSRKGTQFELLLPLKP